jgi:hypothetical protein
MWDGLFPEAKPEGICKKRDLEATSRYSPVGRWVGAAVLSVHGGRKRQMTESI